MPLNIPTPAGQACSYGGITFDSSFQTTSFDLKTQYDASGRTVAFVEVSITVRAYVVASGGGVNDSSTDRQMNQLRQTLQQPGLPFLYASGAGTFDINGPGGIQDIDFGPKPQLIRFKPLGGANAARIYWSVVVRIPECPSNTSYTGLKEFAYRISWVLSRGLTRRTIAGHFVIANNFTTPGGRVTRDSADQWRDGLLNFAVPPGMHRLAPQTYTLSENRSREDFQLIDESLPGNSVPPPFCTKARFNHHLRLGSLYSPIWDGHFAGEYTLRRGDYAGLALLYFVRSVLQRLRTTWINQVQPPPDPRDKKPIGKFTLLRGFSVEEPDAFSEPQAKFSLDYTFSTSLSSLLAASALWLPLPDSDWTQWATSMANIFGPRGQDNMGFTAGEVVISLCQPSTKPTQTVLTGGTVKVGGFSADAATNVLRGTRLDFGYPDPGPSWLYFSNRIITQRIDSTIELKSLPPTEIDPSLLVADPAGQPTQSVLTAGGIIGQAVLTAGGFGGASLAGGGVIGGGAGGGGGAVAAGALGGAGGASIPGNIPGAAADGTPDLQTAAYSNIPDLPDPAAEVRSGPSCYVWLVGSALRAGYYVSPPVLTQISGSAVVPANNEECFFSQHIGAIWGGVPVVVAHWKQRWLVLGLPDTVPMPGTPLT